MRCSLLILLVVLAACRSTSTAVTVDDNQPARDPNEKGQWFCQSHVSNEEWDCIQDNALVTNPQPERIPPPREVERPVAGSLPGGPPRSYGLRPVRETPPRSAQPTPQAAAPVDDEVSTQDPMPDYVRLSYRPERPVSLLELPEDFWVVQLVSLSSREALEDHARNHGLQGMSAAQIWSQGQFFYILILGIYETREYAERASTNLPPPFDTHDPWIRSVGSLQRAMRAAEQQLNR